MKKERKIRVDLTLSELEEIKCRLSDRIIWTEEKKAIANSCWCRPMGIINLCDSIINRCNRILDKINPAIDKEIARLSK